MTLSRSLAAALLGFGMFGCSGSTAPGGSSSSSTLASGGSAGATHGSISGSIAGSAGATGSTGSPSTNGSAGANGSTGASHGAATAGSNGSTTANGSTSATTANGSSTSTNGNSSTSTTTATGSTGSASATGSTGGSSSSGSSELGSCDPTMGYTGNSQGIGAYCSSSDEDCGPGLICAADYAAQLGGTYPVCVQFTCPAGGCGAGACCASYGGFSACIPTGCGFCGGVATSSSSGSTGSTGSTSGSTTGSGSTSGGSGSSSSGGLDTTPITGLTANSWSWVDFPTSTCRDGSATGIGVNPSPDGGTNVMIFLEGGGACFNAITCAENPSAFGSSDLAAATAAQGILDRADPANPVADWNWVYVPYCTGDVHAGGNPNGSVPGVGTEHFTGYTNITAYLARLGPTFPNADQVLLTGVSAGGFGAALNYSQVARTFSGVTVDMIDDSGPFMEDPYLSSCLQSAVTSLWGLTSTILADCNGNCTSPATYLLSYEEYVIASYPDAQFGLMDSTDDSVITQFFGFGQSNCSGTSPLTAAQFDAGLMDIRNALSSDDNFGTFYFAGTDHTSDQDSNFDTRTTALADGGTIALTSWTKTLIGGQALNVGP